MKLKVKHENLKCMGIMQDNLCHPYILSTTVLSDNEASVATNPLGIAILLYRCGSRRARVTDRQTDRQTLTSINKI